MKVWFRWFPFQTGDFRLNQPFICPGLREQVSDSAFWGGLCLEFCSPTGGMDVGQPNYDNTLKGYDVSSRCFSCVCLLMGFVMWCWTAIFESSWLSHGAVPGVVYSESVWCPGFCQWKLVVFQTFFKTKKEVPRYLVHKCDGMKFLLFLLMSLCVLRKWLWRLETLLFNEFFLGCKWYYLWSNREYGQRWHHRDICWWWRWWRRSRRWLESWGWWKLMIASLMVLPQCHLQGNETLVRPFF